MSIDKQKARTKLLLPIRRSWTTYKECNKVNVHAGKQRVHQPLFLFITTKVSKFCE